MDILELVHEDHRSEARPFQCKQKGCPKAFSRRSDLARACPYRGCGKTFIQRSALTVHLRVHTGERPHVCETCAKAFSDSSSLARHRRIHSGRRPYRCLVEGCGKSYCRKTTLTKHTRRNHATVLKSTQARNAAGAGPIAIGSNSTPYFGFLSQQALPPPPHQLRDTPSVAEVHAHRALSTSAALGVGILDPMHASQEWATSHASLMMDEFGNPIRAPVHGVRPISRDGSLSLASAPADEVASLDTNTYSAESTHSSISQPMSPDDGHMDDGGLKAEFDDVQQHTPHMHHHHSHSFHSLSSGGGPSCNALPSHFYSPIGNHASGVLQSAPPPPPPPPIFYQHRERYSPSSPSRMLLPSDAMPATPNSASHSAVHPAYYADPNSRHQLLQQHQQQQQVQMQMQHQQHYTATAHGQFAPVCYEPSMVTGAFGTSSEAAAPPMGVRSFSSLV